jgi:hypothetical protein
VTCGESGMVAKIVAADTKATIDQVFMFLFSLCAEGARVEITRCPAYTNAGLVGTFRGAHRRHGKLLRPQLWYAGGTGTPLKLRPAGGVRSVNSRLRPRGRVVCGTGLMECPPDVGLLGLGVCRLDDRPYDDNRKLHDAPFIVQHFAPMNANVIVWDLETVPDLRGFAAANGLSGKTDEEVREAMGDKFPKHIYHSMVCIGALAELRANQVQLQGARPRERMVRRSLSPLSFRSLLISDQAMR